MNTCTDTAEKIRLLQETATVWRRKLGKDVKTLRFGPQQFPLCKAYLGRDCSDCPVADYIDSIFCYGTPYKLILGVIHDKTNVSNYEWMQTAIEQETTFLEKLINIYRDIEDHERSMELQKQIDSAYPTSARYGEDMRLLYRLKARANKG